MKKTELILTALATVAGILMLAFLGTDSTVAAYAGTVLAALANVGYAAQRAGVKKVEAAVIAGVKPGYKTTEFYLSAIATVAGFVVPFLPDATVAQQIGGAVLSALSAVGYTVQRSEVKKEDLIAGA